MNKSITKVGYKTDKAPPAAAQPDNELTATEVQALVTKAVEAAIAKAEKPLTKAEVQAVVDQAIKGLTDTLASAKSAQNPPPVPATQPDNVITLDQVKAMVAEATRAAQTNQPQPAKTVLDSQTATRPQVEIPYGNSKGNLPVHKKQLLNILLKKPMNQGIDQADLDKAAVEGERCIQNMKATGRMGTKALTSTGTNTGDEFVPTDLSSELQRRLYLASDLAAIFALDEIDMPTNPYKFPLTTTRPTFYLEATENTATTATTPGTGEIILDAKKLMGKVEFSYEVDEDSIVPILGYVEGLLGEAGADAWESVFINGDTTATHMDTDTQSVAKAAERLAKGFRKLANAASLQVSLASGGISQANTLSMLKLMGKYGRNKNDLVWICGVKGEADILNLSSSIVTPAGVGFQAPFITGQLTKLWGVPVVCSARCREDLNASAVYDNSTTTKGSLLLVNKRMFLTGRRREFVVETDRNIDTQTTQVVASFRKALTPVETPAATIQSVVIGYNYDA